MTATQTTTKTPLQNGTSIQSIMYSSSSLKSRRRRRLPENASVTFSDEVSKVEVEHVQDLPGEEIWYSREEYDEIKARNSQIVRLIKMGEFEENDDYSCRGLEHKLKEVFRQRRANKFNALNAVLEEQDRQIARGIVDAALVAAAYQAVTIRCRESAHTIAFRDYRFSLNYDPRTPATGKLPLHDNKLGDSNTSATTPPDKKKKKKDKKDKKDKEKRERGKEKDDGPENDQEDPSLSPKGEKKKGGVRKMARDARRMMRRMSM